MNNNNKPVYILGTGLSHDGSACLLKDGKLCVAIEKERITRQKHDGGNDTDAIQYCLDAAGVSIHDVALVVQNANFGMVKHGDDWMYGPRILEKANRIVTISHHLAHAYSAIGTSKFKECAVMVIDGCGSSMDDCIDLDGAIITEHPSVELKHLYFEKDSYYIFKDEKLTPVLKDFSPYGQSLKNYPMRPNTTMHSIGGLYLAVSTYVFSGFEDPGKLMGLAPYGRPGVYDFEIFELKNGKIYVNYDWMDKFDRPCRSYDQFKKNFQYYADIAYWTQKELEKAILYLFNARYALAPSECVAYAGGVALNAVANRRILTETKFKQVYIQPAAGDNGLSVGCAYYGWMEIMKRERVLHRGSMSLGKTYQEKSIDDALAKYGESLTHSREKDYIAKTAELLAEGKTVGWFQGGAEFGPRALGHRSILADPRKSEMRDLINAQIKFREDFRPFAPSVILEDVNIYFDCDYESPYMILVAPVRQNWREVIPSVIHKDHSARIQTVSELSSPVYYQLLSAFKRITGISVLLNTSFNRKGMPIVETPEQAIHYFLACTLDVLVIDNYLIHKKSRIQNYIEATNSIDNTIKILHAAMETNSVGGDLQGVFQLNINGTRKVMIDLTRDKPVIREREAINPDAVIELDEADLQTLLYSPRIEGGKLFKAGKIKIQGSKESALRLASSLHLD